MKSLVITVEKIISLVPVMKELELSELIEAIVDECEKRKSMHLFEFCKEDLHHERDELKGELLNLEIDKQSLETKIAKALEQLDNITEILEKT